METIKVLFALLALLIIIVTDIAVGIWMIAPEFAKIIAGVGYIVVAIAVLWMLIDYGRSET